MCDIQDIVIARAYVTVRNSNGLKSQKGRFEIFRLDNW